MGRHLTSVLLRCVDCPREAVLTNDVFKDVTHEALEYASVANVWPRMHCKVCKSHRVAVFGEDHRLLIHPDLGRACEKCDKPILLPRLQAVPDARTCASCAADREYDNKKRDAYVPQPPQRLAKCPCAVHAPTVVRKNSKTGNLFVGCSEYPRCRWTARLTMEEAQRIESHNKANV